MIMHTISVVLFGILFLFRVWAVTWFYEGDAEASDEDSDYAEEIAAVKVRDVVEERPYWYED